MKIYLTRHGQTNLNKKELMQGRFDEPLNETGIEQAKIARSKVSDIKFDAVYSSPLDRAKTTASIIGDISKEDIIVDERIIEVDFGQYEMYPYKGLGLRMTAYWMFPEIFKAPKNKGVETVEEMIKRSREFMQELEQKDYENVLIVCHGGIIRTLAGYLLDKKNGMKWRPRPKNCEIRVFEYKDGKHAFLGSLNDGN